MRPAGHTLLTARLSLERVRPEDAEALLELFREPDVRRHLLDDALVERAWVDQEILASDARFASGGAGLWALREIGGGPVLGVVGFRPFFEPPRLQLLYALHPERWGLGLATEAAAAVCVHARDALGLDEIEAATDVPNGASARVLERLGLRRVRGADEGTAATQHWRGRVTATRR